MIHAESGYSYLNLSVPGLYRISLNGVDTAVSIALRQYGGVKIDVSYGRAANIEGTGHHADLLTYMAGPVVYPLRTKHADFSAQVLVGAARQSGVNLDGQGGTLTGYVNQFAWLAGGGAEVKFARSTTIRFGADYLRTRFFAPGRSFQGQNNFRSTVALVYYFGGRSR